MKKIAIITNRFAPQVGGAEIVIENTVNELSKSYKVDIYTPLRDKNPRIEKKNTNSTVYRLWDILNPFNRLPNLLAKKTFCPTLFWHLLTKKYDLIHCFPSISYNTMLSLLVAKIKRTPIFLTSFDAFDYSTRFELGLSYEDLSKLSLRKRKRFIIKLFNAVFTISHRERNLYLEHNKNVYLSTVPIVLEEFENHTFNKNYRKEMNIPEDSDIILCLGRVSKIKGQDVFLKSVKRITSQHPKAYFIIAGDTRHEKDFVDKIKEYIRAEKLSSHVKITGVLKRSQILTLLKDCTVHVLPVRFMNSGAVVVETWAAKKPVVHSNRVDPNYVKNNENGFTFQLEDTDDMTEKILKIIKSSELQKKMGQNGRKLVEEEFLYSQLISKYEEAYEPSLKTAAP